MPRSLRRRAHAVPLPEEEELEVRLEARSRPRSSREARSQRVRVAEAQVAVPAVQGRPPKARFERREERPVGEPRRAARRRAERRELARAPARRRATRSAPRTGGADPSFQRITASKSTRSSRKVGRVLEGAPRAEDRRASRSSGRDQQRIAGECRGARVRRAAASAGPSGRTCQRVWPAAFAQSRNRSTPRTEVADAERPGKRRRDEGGSAERDSGDVTKRECIACASRLSRPTRRTRPMSLGCARSRCTGRTRTV